MVPMKLYRLGSDPEFVFSSVKEWAHHLVPASTIITANKALGLTTFIGVDGHPQTAEIRPTPAYNVRRHLLDIAHAIVAVDDYLRKIKKYRDADVRMYAHPYVKNEPLGGHIHFSFFVNDMGVATVQDHNYAMGLGGWAILNPAVAAKPINNVQSLMETTANRIQKNEILGPNGFLTAINYLLMPLEQWVQPWESRTNRNSKYGPAAGEPLRVMWSPRPRMPKYDKWAYCHYEYRVPSTWLVHPWLAYAYFALAKLTALNIEPILKMASTPEQKKPDKERKAILDAFGGNTIGAPIAALKEVAEPRNNAFLQSLRDRLYAVEHLPKLRHSADLDAIQPALRYLQDNREVWFNPYAPVAVDAWRKLII